MQILASESSDALGYQSHCLHAACITLWQCNKCAGYVRRLAHGFRPLAIVVSIRKGIASVRHHTSVVIEQKIGFVFQSLNNPETPKPRLDHHRDNMTVGQSKYGSDDR